MDVKDILKETNLELHDPALEHDLFYSRDTDTWKVFEHKRGGELNLEDFQTFEDAYCYLCRVSGISDAK